MRAGYFLQVALPVALAVVEAGGAGFGTNVSLTFTMCAPPEQPVVVISECLPFLREIVVCRSWIAAHRPSFPAPGTGFCRFGSVPRVPSGMRIVCVRPLSLPCSTAFEIGELM